MGLDVGDKTIGVAMSDETGLIARGVEVIRRAGWERDLARLRALCDEYRVGEVVVGLPRRLNGSLGERAGRAMDFARKLHEALGLPVHTWDERLSTVAAERTLLEADMSRARRRKIIDRMAAAIILQGFLDSRRPHLGG